MKAMIFAAGLGTRLRPLTDTMPKSLVRVAGKPLLQHVIDKLREAGYDDITVNAHHFAEQIRDYLAGSCGEIHLSDESGLLRDTGGGILHARRFLEGDGAFLVHNVDILSNLDLRALAAAVSSNVSMRSETSSALTASGTLATLVVSSRETSRYLLFDDDMRLVGWTNVKTGEVRSPYTGLDPATCRRFAFSGIHVMSDGVFPLMDAMCGADSAGGSPVFPIMDFYLRHAATHVIRGYVPDGFRMVDVGKLDTLAIAEDFVKDLSTAL